MLTMWTCARRMTALTLTLLWLLSLGGCGQDEIVSGPNLFEASSGAVLDAAVLDGGGGGVEAGSVLQDGLTTTDGAAAETAGVGPDAGSSVTDGSVSRWSFHTASTDPTAPDDAPCRKNVVVRSYVFF